MRGEATISSTNLLSDPTIKQTGQQKNPGIYFTFSGAIFSFFFFSFFVLSKHTTRMNWECASFGAAPEGVGFSMIAMGKARKEEIAG